jgi:hypothetical protein
MGAGQPTVSPHGNAHVDSRCRRRNLLLLKDLRQKNRKASVNPSDTLAIVADGDYNGRHAR